MIMTNKMLDRITINPEICHGKPTIRNKRYTVENILEYMSGGDSVESILEEFNDLEKEDILACITFAYQLLKNKTINNIGDEISA